MKLNNLLNFSCALVLCATSSHVNALREINQSSYPEYQTVWNSKGDGPFDLGLVYPLYTGDGGSTAPPVGKNDCWGSQISFHSGYYTFSGGGLPVHVIYYGNGFSSTRQWLINNFLGNIGNTGYWSLINSYSNWGWAGATPKLGSVWSTGVFWDGNYGLNGNNFAEYNEQALLNWAIDNGKIPKQSWSIYAIFFGTDVTYKAGKFVMGASAFCGTHSISTWGSSTNFAYISTQLPTSYSSTCNIAKVFGGAFPNNDYALDNLIAIALHELVETVVAPAYWSGQWANGGNGAAFHDDCAYEPADKCNNMYLRVGWYNNNGNIQVNNQNYLVFPMYDINRHICAMDPWGW